MGTLIGDLCVAALFLSFAALGLRVFRRAPGAEDGRADRLIALFFCAQGLSYAMYRFGPGPSPGVMGGVFIAVSAFGLLEFTRTVFRPDAAWARPLPLIFTCAIGTAFIAPPFLGMESTETLLVAALLRCMSYMWPLVECSRYYAQMRKRMRLGLAGPVLANRFLLWSLWMAGAIALPLGGVAVRVLALLGFGPDATIAQDTASPITITLAIWSITWMIIAVVSLSLSFFPPKRYVAYLNQRARKQGFGAGASGGLENPSAA